MTAPTPQKLMTVQSDDHVTLSVTVSGANSDTGFVFIHGILQSALSWKYQLSAPELEGWKTVAYDLRGHGFSSKPVGTSHYATGEVWARDLAAVILAAGLRRAILVGWSFGGRVMLDFLENTAVRDRIAGLVFIDANTKNAPGHISDECMDVLGRTLSPDMAVNIASRRQFIEMCFEKAPHPNEIEEMVAYNNMTTPDVLAGMLGRPLDHDETMRKIDCPTLVLHGAKDRLSLLRGGEHTAATIPNAELITLPGVGHMPQFEEPDTVNRALQKFGEDHLI